jgi:hypothetical protein
MIEVSEKIGQLKMPAPDGKMRLTDSVSIEEAFPGYADNPLGLALRGARYREGLTQRQLADLTEIPQRHISEMESGERQIGTYANRCLCFYDQLGILEA